MWSSLSKKQKDEYRAYGYILFPEVLISKYDRYALWLVSNYGVVDTHIRDQFSAGGQTDIITINGRFEKLPASFGRIYTHRDLIADTIIHTDPLTLSEYWQIEEISENRIEQWCRIVANTVDMKIGSYNVYKMLTGIFGMAPRY